MDAPDRLPYDSHMSTDDERRTEIPLSRGRGVTVVDVADADLLSQYRWSLHSKGYATSKSGTILMHRLIIGAPSGVLVDHRDGDPLHNWRGNLRLSDHSRNGHNRHVATRSRTGVPGVSRRKSGYAVYIWLDGKNTYLGVATDLDGAASLRRDAELAHCGEISPSLKAWYASRTSEAQDV